MVAALLPLAALAPILVLPLAAVLGARWRRHARGGCSCQERWSWPSGGRRPTCDRSRKLSCPRQQLTGHLRRDEVPPHGNDRVRLQPIGVTIGDTAIPACEAGGDVVASLGQAPRDLVLERRAAAGLDRDGDRDQCERSDEDECRRSQVATTPHVSACTRPRRRSTVPERDRGYARCVDQPARSDAEIDFDQCVADALALLPDELRAFMSNVELVVEDEPPPGSRLLGLYQGVPLTRRSSSYAAVPPDKITIFRGPLERHYGLDQNRLRKEIRRVVLHEIAHHFGISDARLHELDRY